MRSFTLSLASAALASFAAATPACDGVLASVADCNAFPDFAELAEGMGMSWELVGATTSDGYELRLVHLTGASTETMGPVLLHHDFHSDATSWLLSSMNSLPMALLA